MAGENHFNRDVRFVGAVTHEGATSFAAANTIGTGGSLAFSGTGYVSPLGSHRNRVILFDDFLGDVIADQWNAQADTGGTNAIAAADGGTVALINDTTDDDTNMIAHELNWLPSNGIVFEARCKVSDITNVGMFIGLTDAKVETSPNLPVGRSVVTVTSTATDCVGFVYDTDSTTDAWFGIGVKNDVDTAQTGDTIAPVNATYQTFRIEISAAGAATFYINGTQYGSTLAAACTTTVRLTPYIGLANRSASAHTLTCDYVYVECARA